MHGDIEVTGGRTAQPRFALAGQTDALAVLDTRWDSHVDGATASGDAGAPAFVAGVLDDRAAPAAVRAGLGESERALVAGDHAGSVAGGAHLGAGSRPGSAAVAVGARSRAGQPQRHGHALGGFQEVEFGLGFQILTAPGPGGARLGAPVEQAAEEVADVGPTVLTGLAEQVVEIEAGAPAVVVEAAAASTSTSTSAAAAEATAEATAGEHPAGLVVLLALGLVGQHIARFADLLVPILGGRIVRVAVRMILGEQLLGHSPDLIVAGVGGDAEHLVEILLNPFTLNHAASPPHELLI